MRAKAYGKKMKKVFRKVISKRYAGDELEKRLKHATVVRRGSGGFRRAAG